MGKLTVTDKYKIQNGVLDGKTAEELSTELRKSLDAVTEFLDEFKSKLDKTSETVTEDVGDSVDEITRLKEEIEVLKSAQAETQESEPEPEKIDVQLNEDVIIEVLHKLRLNNVKKEDAQAALSWVTSKLAGRIDDPAQLAALCMQAMNVQNSMIRQAAGGQEGVAVMTSTASQIIEEKAKVGRSIKSDRGCIFNPKGK